MAPVFTVPAVATIAPGLRPARRSAAIVRRKRVDAHLEVTVHRDQPKIVAADTQ